MRKIEYTVPAEYSQKPLLHFLKGYLKLSQRITQALRHTHGAVLVNGNFARLVDKVSTGDKVTITIPRNKSTDAPLLWDEPLDIIFEDEDLLIINKPSGVSTHPTFNHPNGTLCNAVASYLLKKTGEPSFYGSVGRLDKVTSGVMIFAKNKIIASRLNGNLKKTYLAIATGKTEESGTINAPIYRPDPNKTIRAVGKGDEAITHYQSIARFDNKSFLEIKTETGRTHQIRVHLAHIGHVLLGDEMYGAPVTENLKRAALHCYGVSFINPLTNAEMTFTAPLPEDMKKELEKSGFMLDK